jgi:c-di-AMP phosphodiesterase-like protein
VQIEGKTQFYGGKAKAVEKHTRVKARVVAHAINEIIENSDEVFIMGHHNEDFDCFGASMGVAKMARQLGKPVHIVLSDMNEGVDKFMEMLKDKKEYTDLFISAKEFTTIVAINPVLFIVDTHIPHLVAGPELLKRIDQKIIIDHHRRSEQFIENSLLIYIEPASSSTSELVTELLMYFSEELVLTRMDATALYSGIVVDTKNFAVQTGVRTFDAAAYLRRSGADPVMVRHLFRTDYETNLAKARATAGSQLFEGGLIVAVCPENTLNIQTTAAQVADSLLRIESVRMSLVLFQLEPDIVGISARSSGEINVQVIMENFGGGGHQNVAGAQIKGESLEEVKKKAIDLSLKYIKENDKDEGNITAGH